MAQIRKARVQLTRCLTNSNRSCKDCLQRIRCLTNLNLSRVSLQCKFQQCTFCLTNLNLAQGYLNVLLHLYCTRWTLKTCGTCQTPATNVVHFVCKTTGVLYASDSVMRPCVQVIHVSGGENETCSEYTVECNSVQISDVSTFENQTCSGGTVECNRVQIRHVYTLKIHVVQLDVRSTLDFTRVIRVGAWHACQHVVVDSQHSPSITCFYWK